MHAQPIATLANKSDSQSSLTFTGHYRRESNHFTLPAVLLGPKLSIRAAHTHTGVGDAMRRRTLGVAFDPACASCAL